jgi:hypothetical protein
MLLFSPALLVRLFLGGAVAIGGLAAYGATLLLEKPDAMKVVAALAVMGLIGTLVALLLVIFSGIITPLLKAHWSSKVSFILFDTLWVRFPWLVFAVLSIGFYPMNVALTDPQSRTGGLFSIQYLVLTGIMAAVVTFTFVRWLVGRRRRKHYDDGIWSMLAALGITRRWAIPVRVASALAYLSLTASFVCWLRVVHFAEVGLQPMAVALMGLAILPVLAFATAAMRLADEIFFRQLWQALGSSEDPNHPVMRWLSA